MTEKTTYTQVVFNFPVGLDEDGNTFLPSVEAQKTVTYFDANGLEIASKTHRAAYASVEQKAIAEAFGDLGLRLDLQKKIAELEAENAALTAIVEAL